MTTSIAVTGWGTLDGIWDDSDPVDLALSSASLADGVRDLLELKQGMGNYTTAALLLAASPSAVGYYTATNALGAFFYWSGSAWTMYGTARFATAAARNTALTAPAVGWMSRIDAEMFDRRATGSGTTWVPYGASEFPIIPTSVSGTGVTLGTRGKITGATASTVGVNGCFTSDFANYRVVVNVPSTSTANSMSFRLRASGTDDSSANYDATILSANNNAPTGASTIAATSITLNGVTTAIQDTTLEFTSPQLTETTRVLWASRYTPNPMTAVGAALQGKMILFRNTTAFDGFSLTTSTGTANFTVRIYGSNNED